ncbi:uncharacterized protein LOC124637498 [Helicoverpa zea]|uniref:uncharacterized protein LOC124637498 n=1 Tax=Helicoverpa zea TaxID=7113 RepID=UPI001F593F20|nr:uncharacterized protein LOC124637498 [Helicoverpa zea]
MRKVNKVMSDRARAYPTGDAQEQHPAPVGNGQGLSHQNGRVRRKMRARSVRELRLRYASWNVGTMTGRGRELADVLKRRRINVACLQETKWKGARAREIGEGYKFFYCGSDGKRNGVGIVLDNRLKECVVDVKRMNDRLIAVKLIVDGKAINVISVYAPQSGCEESVKEKFWEDFDCLMMNVQDSEEVYVGGDFNGHVGRESHGYERVHGGRGFGTRNASGETLLQAASAFDLAITNTWFNKREEHLVTYKSGHHATQIDYFLVKRSSLCCVKNCKVLPGEALVTQHRLVILDVKVTVLPKSNKDRPPPRIRWRMLEKEECADVFRSQVVDKMSEMKEMEGRCVNECWSEMASHIRVVAKDVCGESRGKGLIDRDTWWRNDEVQKVLKEKKVAFKEWQNVEIVNASLKDDRKRIYMEWKRKAKKAVAVARAKAQERLYNSLDSPRGQKELYRITKERKRRSRDITHIKCMKDESGKVLCKDEEIKERWKIYFEKLMNEENVWNGILQEAQVNKGLVREISMDEVERALGSMKNGKALGPDDIPAEVWKVLKRNGCMWLTLFFNKLLHEEVIPQEWCSSSLVPIFKNKGDVQDCGNYRGIKLMSHTMKVWEKVIEKRVREESGITQNQFGFMPVRLEDVELSESEDELLEEEEEEELDEDEFEEEDFGSAF